MFRIEWANRALRQLLKIQLRDRVSITDSVKQLAQWPKCKNVKALRQHQYQYRLRIGRYRVFFNIEATIRIIKVEEVKKRDERTY